MLIPGDMVTTSLHSTVLFSDPFHGVGADTSRLGARWVGLVVERRGSWTYLLVDGSLGWVLTKRLVAV